MGKKPNQVIFVIVLAVLAQVGAAEAVYTARVEEGVTVIDPAPKRKFAPLLMKQKVFTIDHPNSLGYEVYGPKGTKDWLTQNKVPFEAMIPVNRSLRENNYPSFKDIEKKLKDLANQYSKITRLFSIGKSVQGRDLYVMKISGNPGEDLPLPEVKYISSMHGDEITGRELMIAFMGDLLAAYGKDSTITKFIDETEIFIMPSMNPDGSEVPERANAHGVDLNRNFPDFSTSDNKNSPEGREPETQAVMKFQAERKFVLSANFHGGAEVMNYMWDTDKARHPLDAVLKDIATQYSSKVPYMWNSTEFPKGITNGFDWYEVNGGMQDWSNFWYGDVQFTVELSNEKWPPYSQIPGFYKANKEALLAFLMRAHQGIGFRFRDRNQEGKVELFYANRGSESRVGVFSFDRSEYYQILPPGDYRMVVHAKGKAPIEVKKTIGVRGKIDVKKNIEIL